MNPGYARQARLPAGYSYQRKPQPRVTCIDRLTFDENGFINPERITFEGMEQTFIKP
ncbi:MAG: hypothetical protein LBL07_13425 [Tannerella sp.]|nr:hypothetical protein [Tannerella sp.]